MLASFAQKSKSLTAHKAAHVKKDSKCNECEKVFDTKCKLVNKRLEASKYWIKDVESKKHGLKYITIYQCCFVVSLCH